VEPRTVRIAVHSGTTQQANVTADGLELLTADREGRPFEHVFLRWEDIQVISADHGPFIGTSSSEGRRLTVTRPVLDLYLRRPVAGHLPEFVSGKSEDDPPDRGPECTGDAATHRGSGPAVPSGGA
jgi:hypothetical protein